MTNEVSRSFYCLLQLVIISLCAHNSGQVAGQLLNRAPHFVPGGDMARFSLSENTPIGSPVYQLRGTDPEGSLLHYSISGPIFTVDRDTGVVRLQKELDREQLDLVEVIISLTDEGVLATEPNTVSLRREIPIRDFNDNSPVFQGRPYSASISEVSPVGSVVEVKPKIIVTDKDEGRNSDLNLSCFSDRKYDNDDICDVFHVSTEKISEGNFTTTITLMKQLDFETRPSYVLTIQAKDGALENVLTAYATVAINVIDVQDQQPVFANAPYSATIQENTPAGTSILTVKASDGDTGHPNPIHMSIEDDVGGHFQLLMGPNGSANLVTTDKPLDRESPAILTSGGVYAFNIRAVEVINNELPGDSTVTQVTIVVTDVNDHIPEFNVAEANISIAENLEQDTPLPGLSLYVNDKDLGMNSRYNLSLENIHNSENVFAVSPLYGEGRSAIVVKVIDSSKLDFDVADQSLTRFSFFIVASVDGRPLSRAQVNIQLEDANDNSPVFAISNYHLTVKENSPIGFNIANISAMDADTGAYGKLKYYIKGFGSELYATNINEGGVFVNRNLDYEEQKSYSLNLVAIDGGGRENNTNLYITIEDENDNPPQFESLEYTRTIREGATQFEPQFFVRAFDVDGPKQGGGKVTYAIEHENSISGHVFAINSDTGEVKITHSVNSMDTERGQYELVITAIDHGLPPLKNDTRALIRVGISGNQRPLFKGHFSSLINGAIPGPPSYRVSIPENAPEGFVVTTVQASDPDGIDALLEYKIVGSNDNFILNGRTGQITVSADARLDRDINPHSYDIAINAVDAGFPIPETATTTVHVTIVDVNDKPPKFNLPTYVAYVSEVTPIGTEIITVSAKDTDMDADLRYTIIEPIKAASKAGLQLTSTKQYNYKTAVKINETTGTLTVNQTLNYDLTSVITLTIKVEDLNAAFNKEKQFDTTEVTFYIQSFKDTNPIFKNKGWTYFKPNITAKVEEEQQIGSTIFTLLAEDPVDEVTISWFQLIEPDKDGYFMINERNGDVILKKRLDYEALNETQIVFTVIALSTNGKRQSKAHVNFTIVNVNDNIPVFDKKNYRVTIVESARHPAVITTVSAKDEDKSLTTFDDLIGYNKISYHLAGTYANLFIIDNKTGEIKIAKNQVLDREKQSVIKLIVIAEDSPGKPSDSRKSTTEVLIDILDVNDNPPIFEKLVYSAVTPENAPVNTFVASITATDPDEGPGGEIRYDFLNEGETNGLLTINSTTGEVRTKLPLTGKGRSDPYELVVRAQDNGNQIPKQISLFNDVTFVLYIGDSNTNDGIPVFIAPKIGHIANVSENATVGSPVFQVIASDPDSPSTPSGILQYRIQEDIIDAKSFRIDPNSGLITTLVPLDRETKDSYKIIVEVADMGAPPQAATRVLRINVLDIDDHQPVFLREVNDPPLELLVLEEQPVGAIVGNLTAIDEDIGANGAIDYVFTNGNEQNMFKIVRTDTNSAIIMTAQRFDRETMESFLLTVKCFKHGDTRSVPERKSYYRYDKAEMQVLIKIVDIDDHLPEFLNTDKTTGIRHNLPIDTSILTVKATDKDIDAMPIVYSIVNATFVPQFYRRHNDSAKNLHKIFSVNNRTGEIRTKKSLSEFVDGYFELIVRANNSKTLNRFTDKHFRVYIIRDKSLMRFVFAKPPIEVNTIIKDFTNHIQSELKAYDLELNVFAAHVLSKPDHSLDFSSTSSCFQLSRHGAALSPHEMDKLINSEEIKNKLLNTYLHYSVQQVDSCAVSKNVLAASTIASSGTWLVILAGIIGLGALIVTLTTCCMFKRYHRQASVHHMQPRVMPSNIYESGPILYSEPIYGPL